MYRRSSSPPPETSDEPSLSLAEARKQMRRFGTAHAHGDALRAMYVDLIVMKHAGDATKYYAWFQGQPARTDQEISKTARVLMRDRLVAWDVLLGNDVGQEIEAAIAADEQRIRQRGNPE